MSGERAPPARGRPGPRRWLLLPGWGFGPGSWDPVREALPARLSTRALSPFSGEAGRTIAAAHAAAETAPPRGLIGAWLDGLRAQAGEDDDEGGGESGVGLAGWSLGGLLAIEWARRHPREVGALVLVSATPRFVQAPGWSCAMSPADFEAFERTARARADTAFTRLCALSALGEPEPASFARRLRALRCVDAEPGALAAGLAVLGAADLRAGEAPAQPVALLHGERDAVVPAAADGHWAARLRVARHERLAEAGHAVPLAHPARVSDAIISLSGS